MRAEPSQKEREQGVNYFAASSSSFVLRMSSGSARSAEATFVFDVSATRASPVAVSSVHTCHGSVAEKRTKAARDPSAESTRSSHTPLMSRSRISRVAALKAGMGAGT